MVPTGDEAIWAYASPLSLLKKSNQSATAAVWVFPQRMDQLHPALVRPLPGIKCSIIKTYS